MAKSSSANNMTDRKDWAATASGDGLATSTPAQSSRDGVPNNNAAVSEAALECPGTVLWIGSEPLPVFSEQQAGLPDAEVRYENIGFLNRYKRWSAEELRLADYNSGVIKTPVHNPFAYNEKMPNNTTVVWAGRKRPRETDVGWLRNRYFGTYPIAVKCGSDEQTYLFPREVLMQNFSYFEDHDYKTDGNEKGLSSDRADDPTTIRLPHDTTPRNAAHHFKNITTHTFARLDELIAARHLGLRDSQPFNIHTTCLLATILLRDRRKLTADHINLVSSHPAFSDEGFTMEVFVKAGMRPFLQSTMLSKAPAWKTSAMPGHASNTEWISILKHCRELRTNNKEYAQRLMKHVGEVMENCGRTMDGNVLFHDSLDDDEMKGRRELGFDVTFSV